MTYLLLITAGLAGGFLSGLLGIGGGIIYIVVLPFALKGAGVADHELIQFVIANSIFTTFIASLAGNLTTLINKDFLKSNILYAGIAGGIVALVSLQNIVNTSLYKKDHYNVVIVIITLYILYKNILPFINKKSEVGTAFHNTYQKTIRSKKEKAGLVLSGVGGGVFSAFSGLGGGTIVVTALTNGLKYPIKKAKNISLGFITITSLIMVANNFRETPDSQIAMLHKGYIIFPLVIPLIAGVLISAPMGVMASKKWNGKRVQLAFTFFVFFVLCKKLYELAIT